VTGTAKQTNAQTNAQTNSQTNSQTKNELANDERKSLRARINAGKKIGGGKVASAAGTTARWLFIVLVFCIFFIALLLIMARIGLPFLGNYKGEVETRLSEQLKSPVVIDDLTVRWEQFGPKLSANGVSLSESAQRQVSLDEVLIDVNMFKSIRQGAPVIDELILVGAKLALETSENGKFRLQGLKSDEPVASTPKKEVNVLSWLMNTPRVELRDATISLLDKNQSVSAQSQPIVITNLNVLALNDNELHQLRVDVQLPPELGGQVEMGLDLTGSSESIQTASADFHLKASNLRPDAWRSLQTTRLKGLPISATGIARLNANMNLELWGTASEGKLQSARGQLMARDLIDLKTRETVLDSISTDVVFSNQPMGWQLSTDSLTFKKDDEVTSVNSVIYHFKPAANTAWKLDARGESLKLDVANKLVLSLFDKDADLPRARWLADARPTGDLLDWDASFALIDGKPDFSLFSIFNNVELQAAAGIPGSKNIGGTIDMQHNVGKIIMQGIDAEIDAPSAYSQALYLNKIYGEMDIDVRDPQRTSIQGDIVIEDDGFQSSTRMEVKLQPGSSPHLYVQGKFSLDDLAQTKDYFPVRLFKPATTRWINDALIAGSAVNGELLMFGDAGDFPYKENEGVFKVGFDLQDATIAFMPSWPSATDLQGRFDMEGASIRGSATDGKLESMRLSNLNVRIDDLTNPVVKVSSTGSSSLANLVNFGNTGPLKALLSPALSDVTASGRAQMDVNIEVPLRRATQVNTIATAQAETTNKSRKIPGLKVNGSVFLNGNDVALGRAKLDLSDLNGAIGFSQSGVRVNNLEALMFGRPVRLDSTTQGEGNNRAIEITVAGPIGAANILNNYQIPLTQFVEGESQWNVRVLVPMNAARSARDGIQVAAVSGLVGTRMILPEPLGKPVGTSVRMALSTKLIANSQTSEWLIDYGDNMRSLVKVDADGLKAMSLRFGGEPPNANIEEGMRIEGSVESLGVDGWVQSVADLINGLEPSVNPKPIMRISADINVTQFGVGRAYVGGGSLRFNTDNTYVNGVIESPWLSGSARYPREHWDKSKPAIARIRSIDKRFIDALATAPASENPSELDPRLLPPLQVRVAQIRWDMLDLKDLTVRTSPAVSGLNIDAFGFAYQSAQLIGKGYWRLRDPQGVNIALTDQHVTKLDLTLQSDNFGALLNNVGFGGNLANGQGVIEGSLIWPAPAYKPSLDNLVGEMNLDMSKGRILKVEPGGAKLAGLFALEAIPRRLGLDFKDMVLDGLDYETIRGDVQLANAIAHVPLVQLNGTVGVVDITGESNLKLKTYNQRLTVLPRVSAALPIIGVITGGATAGIGALFAGGLLKAIGLDFDRIGLRHYTLKGDWDEPEVTLVPFDAVSDR